MVKSFLLLSFMVIGYGAHAQNPNSILDHYINVKNALVIGNGHSASAHIESLYNTVKQEENFPQKSELLKSSEKLLKAGDNLDKQRAAFNDVSTAMWDLVKDSDKVHEVVYYQFCPMKKAYWLSYEQDIKNPFYGSSMLTCGKVVDIKEKDKKPQGTVKAN
ncbi:DUF3347 domain-containing protein [Aquiflexum sp.]|uniref:DUF3347 domain-containing protein n=1 Tax=Aquiflexum sp. TaxID=1872584 RepID=UPI0035937CFF